MKFLVASQSQTYRLAMQRKVFDIGGAPHLTTRDGSLFETAATLKHLIAEERRRAEAIPSPEAVAEPEAPALPEPEPVQEIKEAISSIDAPRPAPAMPMRILRTDQPPKGERWRMAGSERRRRAGQHWSVRQKA